MSDTNERTLELAEAHLAAEMNASIEASRSRVPAPGRKTDTCLECGDIMPERRADAGYTKCVTCVEIEECRNGRHVH